MHAANTGGDRQREGLANAGQSSDHGAGLVGLSEQDAARRGALRGHPSKRGSSRSYASIVCANVLTVFNVILVGAAVVTLIVGDWEDALFLGVVVANAAIGITQEVRAKRALDRLSLLVAPSARVLRDGVVRLAPVEQLVVDDVVLLEPGDQVAADGRLLSAGDLRLDESVLSGESEPASRAAGEDVRSGAFVVEGFGAYAVSAVGEDSYAQRLTGEARSFRHPKSPLERAVDRLLYALLAAVVGLGAVLGYALYHRHDPLHAAVATAVAGVATLIPEGLVVLVSLTYAVAAVRMSRRGVLAQQLNAIESLASVDTICLDKTGTLTDAAQRIVEVLPAPGVAVDRLRSALGDFAASASARNATMRAIADACPSQPQSVLAEIPFSSRRRWSAISLPTGAFYLGAPGRLPVGELAAAVDQRQQQGRRVLAVAGAEGPLPDTPCEHPPANLQPLGVVVLAEELRPNVRDTIAFLQRERIEIKVLSGDAPQTVAAIARDVGIAVVGVGDGDAIPQSSAALRDYALATTVAGRISPDGKKAIVEALRAAGRSVAMVGDGVNDVPALKSCHVGIAQGSGTQMARAVADLVLVSGDFASIPLLIAEGRQALRNLQRVSRLYVTKSVLAAFLILTIGVSSERYPLLPRHLSLAACLTLGIPTFFLALAPSSGPWRPDHFARDVAHFAVPAGAVLSAGLVSGYLFALHDLDLSVTVARTVAVTILIVCGLYLVVALEAEGGTRRSLLVSAMCGALLAIYVGVLVITPTRHFFELAVPSVGAVVTALAASAAAIIALALCGFTVRVPHSPAIG
jgi:cation-transporting ATPase E